MCDFDFNLPHYLDKNRDYLTINQARTVAFQEAFQKVQKAKEILMDKEKREEYDKDIIDSFKIETGGTNEEEFHTEYNQSSDISHRNWWEIKVKLAQKCITFEVN